MDPKRQIQNYKSQIIPKFKYSKFKTVLNFDNYNFKFIWNFHPRQGPYRRL